ncbi:MAG: hypothetical protein L6Q59_07240 [Ignavibacteriaceae bacterium]|nr:hypothetical protein [Ignavibacteriaceae bacterium]
MQCGFSFKQETGDRRQDTGHRRQDTGSRTQENRTQDTGKQETGKQDTGDRIQENRKQESSNTIATQIERIPPSVGKLQINADLKTGNRNAAKPVN